jgi:hypothetical protein
MDVHHTFKVYDMPERKISQMTGMPEHVVKSPLDHDPRLAAMRHDPRFAGMTEEEMRRFLREEQAEGVHPSLQGKRF